MTGIQGVGGPAGPVPDRPNDVQNRKRDAGRAEASSRDGVAISSEAQQAAEVQRLVQLAASQDDVRVDKVAAARERLEQGDFKLENRVAEVARQLMKFFT